MYVWSRFFLTWFLTNPRRQVFQGIGGGGMTTVVSILMSDIVPLRDRGVWQGVVNIIYATGSGTGAPLGKRFPLSDLHPLV